MKKRFSKLLILSMTTVLTISMASANAFAEDMINSRRAGMNMHLAKPLDEAKMLDALKKCMAENGEGGVKLREDL